jgi:catechol 2,3-dioxygenase-like lactoylglutathione lyase family enzyme
VTIRRAIPNLLSGDLAATREFYAGFLGRHNPGQDRGVSKARVSVEVEDVDALYAEAVRRGLEIVYPLTNEPWGIRRFFVRDPDGTVINVAQHL